METSFGHRSRVTAAAASAPHLGHAASTVTRLLTAGLVGLRSVPIIAGAALAWPLGARGATSGAAVHLVLAELLTEVTERSRASSADSRRSSGHKSLERDPLTGVYPSLPRAEPRPTGPSRTSLPLWPQKSACARQISVAHFVHATQIGSAIAPAHGQHAMQRQA